MGIEKVVSSGAHDHYKGYCFILAQFNPLLQLFYSFLRVL
jgi:hypothetical protein